MDELTQKKAELMLDVEMLPANIDKVTNDRYRKISMGDLAAGGAVFSSIMSAVKASS